MTPEQLAVARATHWRQDAQPLLTLDDATAWLEQMQLALYLPRKSHVLAPAPSFVEAVLGQGSATPGPEAIQQANALLVRMVIEGTAVPLNLFGTPGEQPDFLIATDALPHLAALQADRNWKKAPARTGPGKVSPLAIEIWKVLEREGTLTAIEIREQLGHEITEAAAIRGLTELWQNLRVAPLPSEEADGAHWQILSVTHKKEMAAGGTMSQSAALSMLVSNYLQSVVTGTAEDVEVFLSPVASRSRLRDVIRGLTATRQLKTLSMDAQTFLFIEGTLPDMPEIAAAAPSDDAAAKPAFMGRSAYRERMLSKARGEDEESTDAGSSDAEAPRRAPFRPAAGGSADRPGAPRRAFGPGAPRGSGAPRSGGAARPSFRDRSTGRPPFRRDAAGEGRTERPARPSYGGSNSDRPRPSFARPREDRPRTERPYGERTGGRPSFGGKPGEGRPFTPRAGGDRPGFKPRSSFGKDAGARPFRPREGGDRPGSGRPFKPREGGRPPFAGRSSDSSRPFTPRPFENKPFEPKPFDPKNSSRAGFMSRAGGRPGRPTGDRPRPDRAAGDRPSSGRPRPPRADRDRPFTPRPFTPRSGTSDRGGSDSRSDSRPPRRFDGKPSFPRRDSAGPRRDSAGPRRESSGPRSDSRPPRREGGSSGYPSNPNRPSRAPRPAGSFVKRDGPGGRPSRSSSSGGRPTTGGRPPARDGKPGFGPRPGGARPGGARPGGAGAPGRNPGGTGRPGGPRVGGAGGRPGGRPAGGASRPGGAGRPGAGGRPGGMRPPTRKPRPEKDSE